MIVHGLFGAATNWRTVARLLAPRTEVHLLDLRNHGRSPHSEDMSYGAMMGDLAEYMDSAGLESPSLLGHSLGGKLAMHFALAFPGRIARLVVADISPVGRGGSQRDIIAAMHAEDLAGASSRKQVAESLANTLGDPSTATFLATNLVRQPAGGFAWRVNLDAIDRGYDALCAPIEPEKEAGGKTSGTSDVAALFLRGGESSYVPDSHLPAIRRLFPNADITTVKGATHWLHSDRPQEFARAVLAFLGPNPR